MRAKPSKQALLVAGTFVEDEAAGAAPVLQWARQEARAGSLREAVQRFAESQQERLDPDLVQVQGLDQDGLLCVIPSRQSDHESSHTFPVSVRFWLNPLTGRAKLQGP